MIQFAIQLLLLLSFYCIHDASMKYCLSSITKYLIINVAFFDVYDRKISMILSDNQYKAIIYHIEYHIFKMHGYYSHYEKYMLWDWFVQLF